MLHFSVKIIIPYKGLQLCLAIIPEEYNIIFIVILEMTMGNSAAVVCCEMVWDGSEAVCLLFCGSFLHAYPVKTTQHTPQLGQVHWMQMCKMKTKDIIKNISIHVLLSSLG